MTERSPIGQGEQNGLLTWYRLGARGVIFPGNSVLQILPEPVAMHLSSISLLAISLGRGAGS